MSTDLTNGYVTTLSASGPNGTSIDLLVDISSGVSLNGDVNVTQADISGDNGIIHVIDKVLTPPSVVEIAINNNDFTSLVSAVIAGGLDDDLSAAGPFTVFAPTNDAFAQLLTDLGVSSLSEIPNDLLISVLTYHVVPGNVTSADIQPGFVQTLNDEAQINISVDGGNVIINGDVNVVATDVQGTNGVVHVIDKVLVPAAPTNSIVDIAIGDENFSTLVQAVTKAGLVETLSGDGDFTVFAPTNAAFDALFAELGITLDDLSEEQVRNIVLYHGIGSSARSTDLTNGYVSTLNTSSPDADALSLLINIDNGVFINGTTQVIAPDVEADNGIVHVIDEVLMPPTVVDLAIANNSFSSLVSAVVAGGLVDNLSAEGPFTVFAPTNQAFDNLLSDLGVTSIDQIDQQTLINVLTYHVVPGNVRSDDIQAGNVPTLLTDAELTLSIDGANVSINGDVSVIDVDVQGTNGVVHVINKVLLPPTSNNIVDIALGDENFSMLVAAVTKAGLAETLSGDGNFTVFAPTNDAFMTLFNDLGVTLDDLTEEQVRNIVLYHAVGTGVFSGDLTNGYVPTLNTNSPSGDGLSMLVNIDNGVTLNGDVTVTMADIEADNGVVHVINKVLLPPNVIDAAIDNSIFTSLVSSVGRADLVNALSAEGPFTVFAPTNDAFAELLTILNVNSVEEIDMTVLTNTLLYHVVSGNVRSDQLSNTNVATLYANDQISVVVENGEVTLNGNVKVILTDVQTTNGVIHVIEKVLLPNN
jgi:transforming growth factor-beta-induced protein